MTILSLIGILVGITLFIVLAFKGVNLFFSALLASALILLTSGLNVLDGLNTIWMGTVAGFLSQFFLIFVFSSLFGKSLSDGKASRSIAVAFAKLVKKSKHNQKLLALLFVPIMYCVLSYVGITSFVIVFTVLTMGRDLFQECDVPWRFYFYGGASTVGTVIIGGTLQLANIMLAKEFGTGLTAAMGLSIVGGVVYFGVTILLAKLDLNKAERNGEGFLDSGALMKNEDIGKEGETEDLPNVFLSFVPMVAVIGIATVFNQVLVALVVGILLNFILFKKYIPSVNETITTGLTSGFAPVISVAATMGISSVIAAAPGFAIVTAAFDQLPPLIGGVSLIALVSFLTASPTAALPTFGPAVFDSMVASGISAQASHRIIAASVFTCVGPHSPGVVNAATLAKVEYKKAAWLYLKASMVPGLAAIVVMMLCIQFGILV